MVRRMVTDAGVRFADDVNPEDWDFWLQATHAGFLGVAVPEAVLLWRRWGFTRLSEATRADGGLEQAIRRRRPEYFTPDLLARLKREWAPALTIVAPHADGDRAETQITEDYEVVPAEGIRTTRGRYLLLAPDGAGRSWTATRSSWRSCWPFTRRSLRWMPCSWSARPPAASPPVAGAGDRGRPGRGPRSAGSPGGDIGRPPWPFEPLHRR